MEILDLRHFNSTDLRPLLDEETEHWLSRLDWDYSSSSDMILRYVDARILPGYAAVERGRIRGYCFFVYEGAKGVIGDMFVDPFGYTLEQVHKIEQELLTTVIETLQQSPGIHRVEAQLLIHNEGQASQEFIEAGFRCYSRFFMEVPIANGMSAPNRPLRQEVEIRPWMDGDYQPAAQIITAAYRGHVDSDINDQYRSVPGSLRFLNNIVRFPGCGVFDPSSSFVAVHRLTRQTIGLILCSRVRNDVGHITQVCLMPEFRSFGIGEHLIMATARALQSRGARMLSLTVTQENERAVALYRRLGFQTRHVFDAFVWES
ncbi:MAG TPA: GNAT family N-acetyltransferase [Terriglobales bacterium]